jgi:precorrin-6B methylase 2
VTAVAEMDYDALWRQLVQRAEQRKPRCHDSGKGGDDWAHRAQDYLARVRRRWSKPDSTRTTVLSRVSPGDTLLDIGAGAGLWSAMLAPHVEHVTAVEPSPAMREQMSFHLAAEGITNVEVIAGAWPDVDVPRHDYSLCSHAMYGCPDLPRFVERMQQATRHTCMLVMRVPTPDGVMAQASNLVHGHPHDSPNALVAYPLLWQMGIFADLQMEDTGTWGAWTSESLEAALQDVKGRLGIGDRGEHDAALAELLQRRLRRDGEGYRWPPGVRSALLSWEMGAEPPKDSPPMTSMPGRG